MKRILGGFSKRGASYLAIAIILLAVVNFAVITVNAWVSNHTATTVGGGYKFDKTKPDNVIQYVYYDHGSKSLYGEFDGSDVLLVYNIEVLNAQGQDIANVLGIAVGTNNKIYFCVYPSNVYEFEYTPDNWTPIDFKNHGGRLRALYTTEDGDKWFKAKPFSNYIFYINNHYPNKIYKYDIITWDDALVVSVPSSYGFVDFEVDTLEGRIYAVYSDFDSKTKLGVWALNGTKLQDVLIYDGGISNAHIFKGFGDGKKRLLVYLTDETGWSIYAKSFNITDEFLIDFDNATDLPQRQFSASNYMQSTTIRYSNTALYINGSSGRVEILNETLFETEPSGGGSTGSGGGNGTAYYNITFNFVNSETGLPLNGVGITLEIYKNGELQQTIDTVVDSGFTLEVSEGSMIQIKQASKSGFISELEQAGMCKIVWVDPDLNPFLTNPYNVTIVFYPTTTNAKVHFLFIDTKTNAQIPDVDFVLKDTGDHVIAEGTYDYEFVLENATRGQWYWYNASKPGYFSTGGGYQVPTDSQTDYYVYVYMTPITQASDEENNTVVEFQILDSQTWDPIDGAVVTLNGVSKVTNSAGFAHFEVPKDNTYSYLVSAEGYYSKSGVVEVGTDQVLETVYLLALPSGGGGTGGTGGGSTGGGTGGGSTGGTGGGGSTGGTGGGETGGGSTGGTGGGGGIDTGYTPDEGLRQAARDTLTQFYKSVPGFFGLIFLLFLMASLQSVMRGFRR